LRLVVRLDDLRPAPQYGNRYNNSFKIYPGPNKIGIPFSALKTTHTDRLLDMSSIETVVLFLVDVEKPITLFYDHFYLE